MIAALIDLERDERRVRGGSGLVWVVVIVFVNVLGPIIDFVAGRESVTASAAPSGDGPRRAGGRRSEARGLTKQFGSVLALDRLDEGVPHGTIFGLQGRNGAGQTTTIRIRPGSLDPTPGTPPCAGVEVGLDVPELRRQTATLTRTKRFYGWMQGRELDRARWAAHGLSRVGRCDRTSRRCSNGQGRRPLQPSGGSGAFTGEMRQRLGSAQALPAPPRSSFLSTSR